MGKNLSKVTCEDCRYYTIKDYGYYDQEQHGPYCTERDSWLYGITPCMDFETKEEEQEDPWEDDIQ